MNQTVEILSQVTEADVEVKQKFKARDIFSRDVTRQQGLRRYLTGGGTLGKNNPFKTIGEEFWYIRGVHRSLLAKTIKGMMIGNSSTIWMTNKGVVSGVGSQLQIQMELSQYIPMIPYVVFEEAGLDLDSLNIIEQGPGEELDFGRVDALGDTLFQHFTGALLLSVGRKYYLFDIDRNEVKMKNFNAWMSELCKPCTSIKEAYDSLKPQEVRDAERFLGHDVTRQGEWYFIPSRQRHKISEDVEAKLAAKGNTPHYVTLMSEDGFVKGKVRHGLFRGDHKVIELEGWHKPVPNTAVGSFKISGAID